MHVVEQRYVCEVSKMAIPEDLWRVPLRILLTVVVSLIVYVCWKCAFALFQVLHAENNDDSVYYEDAISYRYFSYAIIVFENGTFIVSVFLQVFQELFVLATISAGHAW